MTVVREVSFIGSLGFITHICKHCVKGACVNPDKNVHFLSIMPDCVLSLSKTYWGYGHLGVPLSNTTGGGERVWNSLADEKITLFISLFEIFNWLGSVKWVVLILKYLRKIKFLVIWRSDWYVYTRVRWVLMSKILIILFSLTFCWTNNIFFFEKYSFIFEPVSLMNCYENRTSTGVLEF